MTARQTDNSRGRSGIGLQLFWIAALVLIWEMVARFAGISRLILPSVGDVARALVRDFTSGHLLSQTLVSVGMIAAGVGIAFALAILLAFFARLHPLADGLVRALTTLAHPLPGIALMPLIILWFGVGKGAVLAILVHAALWPLLLNLSAGLARTPEIYTDVGRTLSLSEAAISREIRLRFAMPDLIAGTRTGFARAWRAFIGEEMVFGAVSTYGGLGTYILTRRTFMDTAGLFAGLVVIIGIGILIENGAIRLWEKKTVDAWGMRR